MKPWLTIGILLFVFIGIGSLYFRKQERKKKLQKLNNRTPVISWDEYALHFEKLGYPRLHVKLLYEQLLILVGEDQYNFHPQDDIGRDYLFDGLDDIELLDNMCVSLKLPHASQEDIDCVSIKNNIFNATYILELIACLKSNNTKPIPLD